jgi:DNA-binding XRE family transcriptional regulator
MTSEDIEVLKLIKRLLEKESNSNSQPSHSEGDEQDKSLQSTSHIEDLKKKIDLLQEQLASRIDMIKMTLQYVEDEQNQGEHTLNSPLAFSPSSNIEYSNLIEESFFHSEKRLKNFYPQSFVIQNNKDNKMGGFVYIKDENRMLYMVSVIYSKPSQEFLLLSVLIKKALDDFFDATYKKDTLMIWGYLNQKIYQWFGGKQSLDKNNIQVSVTAIHWQESSVSFVGNDMFACVVSNGNIEDIQTPDVEIGRTKDIPPSLTKNTYRLEKGMHIYLASSKMASVIKEQEEDKWTSFQQLIKESSNWQSEHRKQEFEHFLQKCHAQNSSEHSDFFLINLEI